MRLIVVILATLALAKVFTQNQLYRTATSNALIATYRERAIRACQADRANQTRNASHRLWAKPRNIDLEIGRSNLGVIIWDYDHALWEAAYRRPYLVLSPSDSNIRLRCTYDITAGGANVERRG
ncbi:MAG: hypothetical protein K0U74_11435 [Alphaproteobacteria bacterium]|nr:hypothetical protein [Alphaproteobacteria bacterium]